MTARAAVILAAFGGQRYPVAARQTGELGDAVASRVTGAKHGSSRNE